MASGGWRPRLRSTGAPPSGLLFLRLAFRVRRQHCLELVRFSAEESSGAKPASCSRRTIAGTVRCPCNGVSTGNRSGGEALSRSAGAAVRPSATCRCRLRRTAGQPAHRLASLLPTLGEQSDFAVPADEGGKLLAAAPQKPAAGALERTICHAGSGWSKPFRCCGPSSMSSKRSPSSRRVVSATTTMLGPATYCRRAARLRV